METKEKEQKDEKKSDTTPKPLTLRVKDAQDGVTLAGLQQQRAQIQVDQYEEWLSAGRSTGV